MDVDVLNAPNDVPEYMQSYKGMDDLYECERMDRERCSCKDSIFKRSPNFEVKKYKSLPEMIPPECDDMKEYVEVGDGLKMYYECKGKGTAIVLLSPGPGFDHQCYHPYLACFAIKFRVIFYDPIGVGKSSRTDSYSCQQMVEHLEILRKELGINSWILLGWSFGGFLAQFYATKHPENVISMILVNSGTGFHIGYENSLESELLNSEELEFVRKNGDTDEELEHYNYFINYGWMHQYTYKLTDKEVRSRYYRLAHDEHSKFHRDMYHDMTKQNLLGSFDDIKWKNRVLILESKFDFTWVKEKSDLLIKNHPYCLSYIFTKSNHNLIQSEPFKFALITGLFLNGELRNH